MSWLGDIVGNVAGSYEYYFGGGQEEEARGRSLDSQLADLNTDALNSGRWDQGRFDQAETDRTGMRHGSSSTASIGDEGSPLTGDVLGLLDSEGRAGANESTVGQAINGGVPGILKAIPVWAWVLIAIYVFVQFGGIALVTRRVLRR